MGVRNKKFKMIAEKPSWVRHEGMQIFSIDIQPGWLRFATGGGDHKVGPSLLLPYYRALVCLNYVFFGGQELIHLVRISLVSLYGLQL